MNLRKYEENRHKFILCVRIERIKLFIEYEKSDFNKINFKANKIVTKECDLILAWVACCLIISFIIIC